MKYEKAIAKIVEFEVEDIITASAYYKQDEICGNQSFDADHCDGVYQAVTKPF